MNNLKDLKRGGLKGIKENALRGLKVSSLKDLILKPIKPGDFRPEELNDAGLEDLTKKEEKVKRKIRKLNQEKKMIETRIDLIQRTGKEKNEEITDFPWREEIFPPLSRNVRIKALETLEPGTLEARELLSHGQNTGYSENTGYSKNTGYLEEREVKREIKITGNNPESKAPEDKISEGRVPEGKIPEGKIPEGEIYENIKPHTVQPVILNTAEGADPKNGIGKRDEDKKDEDKKDEDKDPLERNDRAKNLYPFSAGRAGENKVPRGSSGNSSIDKSKPENKNNPVTNLLGGDLIEELLSSDDQDPEEEKGFTRYLEEPEMVELINDLKDIRCILARQSTYVKANKGTGPRMNKCQ